MSRTINIEKDNYAYNGGEPNVNFLRKVVADQHEVVVIRADCDLVVTDTIIANGTTCIKAIQCRSINCPSKVCAFNHK